jgi:hypothetical protein
MMLNVLTIYAALAIGGILGYLTCSVVVMGRETDDG